MTTWQQFPIKPRPTVREREVWRVEPDTKEMPRRRERQ